MIYLLDIIEKVHYFRTFNCVHETIKWKLLIDGQPGPVISKLLRRNK